MAPQQPTTLLPLPVWRHLLALLTEDDCVLLVSALQLPFQASMHATMPSPTPQAAPQHPVHDSEANDDATTVDASLSAVTHHALTLCRLDHQLVDPASCRHFGEQQAISRSLQRVTVPSTELRTRLASHSESTGDRNGSSNSGPVGATVLAGRRDRVPHPPAPHFSADGTTDSTAMSARQIAPSHTQAITEMPRKASKAGHLEVPASSSLSKLVKRLTLSSGGSRRRRRGAQHDQQRASWPSLQTDNQRGESFARRAQHSLLKAWSVIHRESTSESLFTPPQFLLRTQRKISQSFNLKIVQAVGKDLRRIESQQRRSSLTMLEAPPSNTSSSTETSEEGEDDYPLNMSERLSLKLGRRISRDFAPMLTEGSPLECRVREMVYSLLRDPATLEGHVCSSFFAKQEDFTSPQPAACRYYLNRVRETISDLVQFIVEYRLTEVGKDSLFGSNQDEDNARPEDEELETAVRRAVEEYFCFSLRYEIRQWSACATNVSNRSRFKRTLAKWSTLPPSSTEFGLKNKHPQFESHGLLALAISKLHEVESIATPSRKMDNLLAACHALSEYIEEVSGSKSFTSTDLPIMGPQRPQSPTTRVCLGDADAFLPLLIFAVSRSKLRDPLLECAQLQGLYPFASQHGERMYYLTMFEASLEFIRNHS